MVTIEVEDTTTEAIIAIKFWNDVEALCTNVKEGDDILVKNVMVFTYRGDKQLKATSRTAIEVK